MKCSTCEHYMKDKDYCPYPITDAESKTGQPAINHDDVDFCVHHSMLEVHNYART